MVSVEGTEEMRRDLADALLRAEVAERRVAELEMEIASLRRLTGNVVALRAPLIAPLVSQSMADDDRTAISRLRIPTYDPRRNLILDPIGPAKTTKDDSAT